MNKIKELNKDRYILCSWIGKPQYCQDVSPSQLELQIQCSNETPVMWDADSSGGWVWKGSMWESVLLPSFAVNLKLL